MVEPSQLHQGMLVLGSDGQRIGQVKTVRDHDFLVDRQRHRDVFVPFDAVGRVREVEREVDLIVAAGDVDGQGWHQLALIGQPVAEPDSAESGIAWFVDPISFVVQAGEPIAAVGRRLDELGRNSALVVEDERPIGLLRRQDIDSAPIDQPGRIARDNMLANPPILTRSMSPWDAWQRVGETQFDRLPVVDEAGRLIGEIPRAVLEHAADTDTYPQPPDRPYETPIERI